MPRLEPANSDFARRVRDSFARQGAMHTLGAELSLLEPGAVDVCLAWAPGLTQQHGFLHAGMVSTALDSACGYAGLTLMPADAAVLTIEFKINLLGPFAVVDKQFFDGGCAHKQSFLLGQTQERRGRRVRDQQVSANSSRPISMRRISLVPAPIS